MNCSTTAENNDDNSISDDDDDDNIILSQQEPTIHFAAFPQRPQVSRGWWHEEGGLEHEDSDREEYEYEDILENIQNRVYSFYTRFSLWLEDTKSQLQQERQLTTRSRLIAEVPFCIATFGSVYGTFILVRAAAVNGWIVDHSHWNGKGHNFDKDPVLAINMLETVAIYTSILCGIVIWILLIARTRMCLYFISKWCLWLAYLQGAFCLSTIYGFLQRSASTSLIINDSSNYVYSRGFWSCLCSGILFIVVGLSFTVDCLLSYPYSKLSIILKGLVLPSILLCFTLSIGTLSYMALEDWTYSEAIVFCWTAITTIGYGDITPSRPEGRIFCLIYTVFGISIVGYMLLSIRAVITGTSSDIMKVNLMRVESLHDYSRNQRQKWMNQQQYRQQVLDNNSTSKTPLLHRYSTTTSIAGAGADTLANNTNNKSNQQPGYNSHRPRSLSNVSTFSNYTIAGILNNKDRQILVQVITKSGVVRMGIILIICWFGGAGIFCLLEGDWTYLDGLYFVFGTQLTIGFGDIVPETALAQEFWLAYIILSIAVAAYFISLCGDTLIEKLQIQDDDEEPESFFYTDEVAGSPSPMDDYTNVPNHQSSGRTPESDDYNTDELPLSSSLSNKMEQENDMSIRKQNHVNKEASSIGTPSLHLQTQRRQLVRHSSLPTVSGFPTSFTTQKIAGTNTNVSKINRSGSFLTKKKPHPLRIAYPSISQQQHASNVTIDSTAIEEEAISFKGRNNTMMAQLSSSDIFTDQSQEGNYSRYGSFSIMDGSSSKRDVEYFDNTYKDVKHPTSPSSFSEAQDQQKAFPPGIIQTEQHDLQRHKYSISSPSLSGIIGEETLDNNMTIKALPAVKRQYENTNINISQQHNIKKKKPSRYLPIAVTDSHKKHH